MFVVTAEEMREIDRRTIEAIGIPGTVLMENAGLQVAEEIDKRIVKPSEIVILAGHGNNGGDGFVIGRHLHNKGFQVKIWFIGDVEKLSAESLVHYQALVNMDAKVEHWSDQMQKRLEDDLQKSEVIIDALLGTGSKGNLREPIKGIIAFVNQSTAFKVAVDIPTGVNSDTGEVVDVAFAAHLTVTFALPKVGQFLYPGASFIGELIIADISIPQKVYTDLLLKKKLITADQIKMLLPDRQPNTHKGSYGHALIIGGSAHMPGAPTMASLGALRSGAGLTTVIVPKGIQAMVFHHMPEVICIGAAETETGHFSLDSLKVIMEQKKISGLGVGPGLGIWDQSKEWLFSILTETTVPLVLDADALSIIANNLKLLRLRKAPTVITPHPGEMARLIQKDVAFVEKHRVEVATDFARKYHVFVVLKGTHTLIATPDGKIYFNTTGSPAMAKGGSGDVLTGMVTSFIAQLIPIESALLISVYLHGLAGELASTPSDYSSVATDIIAKIGDSISMVKNI